jgi:hypothetical protein
MTNEIEFVCGLFSRDINRHNQSGFSRWPVETQNAATVAIAWMPAAKAVRSKALMSRLKA